jgi:hypothetical protein
MKKILTGVLIVAGLGVQAYAQKVKEGTLNFALTRQFENSTNYTAASKQWKTATAKVTSATVIQAIGATLGKTFTASAKLVVEDGDWSGFSSTNGLLLPNGYNAVDGSIVGSYSPTPPTGKQQAFAYIFVRDGTNCVNVSPFFTFQVRECYDCFYLNSFVTDSHFSTSTKTTTVPGPPCCNQITTTSTTGSGSGVDKYYFTLSFDNTVNNTKLADAGIAGINPKEDGINPNVTPSGYVATDPNILRFTLNGILTYSWTLATINAGSNAIQIGSVSYAASGYGFIAKTCNLVSGTVTVSEVSALATKCCSVAAGANTVYDWGFNFNGTYTGPRGGLLFQTQ